MVKEYVVPSGVICLWHGLLANIPDSWVLCDGTNGTPDLRSKFIKGAAAGNNPGGVGGDNTHTHNDHPTQAHSGASVDTHAAKNTGTAAGTKANLSTGTYITAGHSHSISAYSHSVTQPSAHPVLTHSQESNEPVYYEVAFIMKQ